MTVLGIGLLQDSLSNEVLKIRETHLVKCNNEQWMKALRKPGSQRDKALNDLRKLLVQALQQTFPRRWGVDSTLIEDFVQDALIKILSGLSSFRGEGHFTAWARTIALREAFTEMRRLRWSDVSLDRRLEDEEFAPEMLVDRSTGPEKQAIQERILQVAHRIVNTELTEKQRQALIPDLFQSIPRRDLETALGTNRNALYKLTHDARRKLKKGLIAKGLSTEGIRSIFYS